MAPLIDAISHLPPPSGWGPLRLDRFSPYHDDPASFGLVAVRPLAPYRTLYDVPAEELDEIAYYFEFDHADGRDLGYVAPALERIKAWSASGPRGSLTVTVDPDGTGLVLDSRAASPRGYSLEPWQAGLLLRLDDIASDAVISRFAQVEGMDEATVTDFLDACLRLRLVARVGRRWLSLAVHQPARWDEPVTRRTHVELIPT
jgi:hypothetical protein